MNIIELQSIDEPGVSMFSTLTEAQLRNKLEPDKGIFIAESPKVIRVALASGAEPVAMLCERKHISGDAADIVAAVGDIPIYTGPRELLASLTGYTLTRGVLCAMRRPAPRSVVDVCEGAHRLAVLEGLVDPTNVGAIFRNAAALGADGVLLAPNCCDPLGRRAVRVSMGTVFQIPWARIDPADWPRTAFDHLRSLGFCSAAMALDARAVSIETIALRAQDKLAIVLGSEGDGLAQETIESCDCTVCIPMSHGVDSLNVAAASAIAFWAVRG